jgi:hypothetical protein
MRDSWEWIGAPFLTRHSFSWAFKIAGSSSKYVWNPVQLSLTCDWVQTQLFVMLSFHTGIPCA